MAPDHPAARVPNTRPRLALRQVLHCSLRLTVCVLALATAHSWAGDLEPPGPPGSTMKALDQVEPRVPVQSLAGSGSALFVISQPGSYYLTANIVAAAPGHGIEIASDNVTVDLRGFAIIGPGQGVGTDTGIVLSGARSAIAVYNGTIRDWGVHGIDAVDDSGVLARDLRLRNNGGSGLLAGTGAIVMGCSAESNGVHGIQVGQTSSISNCSANNNAGVGISANNNSSISYCTASGNGGEGISTGGSCVVTGSTASANTLDGIRVLNGSSVTNCVAALNSGDGIEVAGGGAIVHGNSASQNSAGAGIHVTGRSNRIEGNTVSSNLRGIDTDDSAAVESNVIIKNSAMCNAGTSSTNATNYAVDAGDDLGPTGSAATATSPWANISIFGVVPCS